MLVIVLPASCEDIVRALGLGLRKTAYVLLESVLHVYKPHEGISNEIKYADGTDLTSYVRVQGDYGIRKIFDFLWARSDLTCNSTYASHHITSCIA